MSQEEKRIQETAERGASLPDHQQDVHAYQLLFKELKKEDADMPALSPFFAENIARKITEKEIARESLKEYVLKVIGLCLFVIAAVIAVVSAGVAQDIIAGLAAFKWYILIASVLLIGIDFADRKFVKKVI